MVKSNKKTYSKRKTQNGGVSNSCVGNYAINNGGAKYNSNNPQASSDLYLDDKTMLYGNPISLGTSIVGGGDNINGGGDKCGDEGVGTSNFKSETFKEYLEKLNSNFNINTTGGFSKMQKNKNNNKSKSNKKSYSRKNKRVSRKRISSQKGSGFTTDFSDFIGGQPAHKHYDDCCPPAIVGGNLHFGAPDQPVCGFGAVKGGGRKMSKTKNKTKNKTNKNVKKSKSNKNKKSKRKFQRGGDFNSIGSKPAEYSTAFSGPVGVFKYPDDMKARTFDETQPIWSPSAI